MSSIKKVSTSRRKKTDDDSDPDWTDPSNNDHPTIDSPPKEKVKVSKTATVLIDPPGKYNHRLHDPQFAYLATAREGTFRYHVLSQVAVGTRIITWLHKARSPIVDAYFIVMSFLGDQVLYLFLLPWFLWVLDPPFGRMFILLLASVFVSIFLTFYIGTFYSGTSFGNFLKNVFAMPRPPSPPLWTHHKHEDFGMPSTHTLNSVSMSLFFTWWIWPSIPKDGSQYYVILFVVWYTTSMFLSRMYLAAHSHVDTISGFILGILYFLFWVHVHPTIDHFMNTNRQSPLVFIVSSLLFLLFHPRSSRPSPSFRYSISLSGLACGMSIGLYISRFVGQPWVEPIKSLFSKDFRDSILANFEPEWHFFTVSCIAVAIGIILLLLGYVASRAIAYITLLALFKFPPFAFISNKIKLFLRYCSLPHPIALDNLDHPQWYPEREVVNPKDVKVLSDLVGTVMVGIAITHFIPVVLLRMGLVRGTNL